MRTSDSIEEQPERKAARNNGSNHAKTGKKDPVFDAHNSTLSASGPKKQKGGVPGAPQLRPYCFKPGQSGNPGGRPKTDLAAILARGVFEENMDELHKSFSKSLLRGNAYAFKELADRGYGKMREEHQVDVGRFEERNATGEELERRIAELDDEIGMTDLRNENTELRNRLAELERRLGVIEKPALPPPGGLKPM